MASLHRQTDRPHWFCAFTTPAGKRYFKSTGTSNKQHAQKICTGWVKAAELASQKNLTPDRARKLIEATVTDVIESNTHGTLSAKTLKKFFEQAAELVEQPKFSRESINVLIGETVKEVAVSSGEIFPNASIRDWCKRWLETKLLEAAPRTHERYELSIRRFLNFIKAKADKDITTLRPDDVLRFRDKTAGELSSASANMDLKVVRACLNAAQRQDLINSNVASKVATIRDRSEIQRRAFSLAEVKTVLEQCDKAGGEWRGLVLAAVYTGQRLGDIAMLTWQQVDLDKNTIAFVTRKTTKRLNLSLATPLKKYFDELPSVDDPKEYVFPKAAVMAEKHTGTISTKFYDEILAPSGLVVERP